MSDNALIIRSAEITDLDALHTLEQACFDTDQLSRRSLRHWISAENRVFLVAVIDGQLVAYVLAILHRGTRLARLYSLAVSESMRGKQLGLQLTAQAEQDCADKARIYMRLEVAQNNHAAIRLYENMGYTTFGTYKKYYEDNQDALRMHKRILRVPETLLSHEVPWYEQSTDFTCGPAALMMAMAGLDAAVEPSQELEMDIWREATTVFMTSGHGGCHPLGLALAAEQRGFKAEVWINKAGPLFLESVRNAKKKSVMGVLDKQFRKRCKTAAIKVHTGELYQNDIEKLLKKGAFVLVLISSYRFDGNKTPHWVVVTAIDDLCLYVHDPDTCDGDRTELDCKYLPVARQDFGKMSSFGAGRLRTALVISRAKTRRGRQ